MAEPMPPSSLTTRQRPPAPPGWPHTLRIVPSRWNAVTELQLRWAIATVLGSWFLLSWGRFGLQGLAAPRALTQFMLVGVYGWIGMSAGLWVLGAIDARRQGQGLPDPARVLQLVGLAHQPLVVLGVVIQVAQLIPAALVPTVAATIILAAWLPAMLVAVARALFDWSIPFGVGATVLVYGGWFLGTGRFLIERVGHLF